MNIKNYKYDNSKDGIHYTVDVDGYEFEVNHTKTDYGSVQHEYRLLFGQDRRI